MLKTIVCAAGLAALSMAWAADSTVPAKKAPAQKTTAVRKRTPAGAGRPTATANRKPAVHTASSRTVPARKPVPRTTWRNRQNVPTPERYKEIQEALAAKGYLKPEDASGTWGEASADALKRFQTDQKIDSTGKINALSLLALGLGPRHDNPTPPPPPKPALANPEAGR